MPGVETVRRRNLNQSGAYPSPIAAKSELDTGSAPAGRGL